MQTHNFKRDFNFFVALDAPIQPVSIKRTVLIFTVSFLVLFTILNFQTLINNMSSFFISELDEEANNLALENLYKNKYASINYLLPLPEMKIENAQFSIQKSLAIIGQATAELNQSKPDSVVAIQSNNANSNYISIPKLGVKAPILTAPKDEKQILNSLKKGVVLYPGSALPGQKGMAVIIGHSSSNFPYTKYSAIFAGLNNLNTGDLIYVNYEDKSYTYVINDKKIGSTQQLAATYSDGDLILGTCWPVGTDKNRIIVAANLQ